VQRLNAESEEDFYAYMQGNYDVRLREKAIIGGENLCPLYKIGPMFWFRGQKFAQIQTFAGSLIMRVMFDAKSKKFERSIIYRGNSDEPLQLLQPSGDQTGVNETELVQTEK
jgi:hypothetical protein